MPRPIDADALNVAIEKWFDGVCVYDVSPFEAVNDFQSIVDEQPTVSPDEVRGVVRCKDCKWCHAGYCEKYDDLIPWGCANKPWEDWFCADGKRREIIKEGQDAD